MASSAHLRHREGVITPPLPPHLHHPIALQCCRPRCGGLLWSRTTVLVVIGVDREAAAENARLRGLRHVRNPDRQLLHAGSEAAVQIRLYERHQLVALVEGILSSRHRVVDEQVLDAVAREHLYQILGYAAAVSRDDSSSSSSFTFSCGCGFFAIGLVPTSSTGTRRAVTGQLGVLGLGDRRRGETDAGEEEPAVLHGELVGGMDRTVAVAAEYSPVLLTEDEPSLLLADIADGVGLRGGGGEGESAVLAGELVGAVDPEVAGFAEGSLVGAAEDRGLASAADIALHLHVGVQQMEGRGGEGGEIWAGWVNGGRDLEGREGYGEESFLQGG